VGEIGEEGLFLAEQVLNKMWIRENRHWLVSIELDGVKSLKGKGE
jgi:hypothetical protein